jgi:hypothetical protein
LVTDRMDELEFAFYEEDGPSRYGRLAIDYLLLCRRFTQHSSTLMNVQAAAAQIEAAAQHTSTKNIR